MGAFKELGLDDELLKALDKLGFTIPSDIQREAIPQLLAGDRDFIGLAQTGTGKTAAFGLPLLQLVDAQDDYTQALVLAPTRELGQQIAEHLSLYSKYQDKINVLAVYGGAAITHQIRALKKTQHIIIATPGRLRDLIRRKSVKLSKLKFLVLDEADEMLQMGFKEEIDEILTFTPEEKHTWLFSATMPDQIKKIVKRYMDDPIEVKIDSQVKVNTNISHQFAMVRHSDKVEALTRFIDSIPEMRGIVFCRTKRDTQDLAERLLKMRYGADAIHGDLSQAHRDRVMRRFKSNELQLLIATDVAARGIDVNDLTHVFHFTLPDDNAYYTHRSGRTARAGKKGTSVAFINGREEHKIRRIGKSLDISFEHIPVPSGEDIANKRIEQWANTILTNEGTGRMDPRLIDKVHLLLAHLTKEEVVERIMLSQLGRLTRGTDKDLNDKPHTRKSSGGRVAHGKRDNRPRGRSDKKKPWQFPKASAERSKRKKFRYK